MPDEEIPENFRYEVYSHVPKDVWAISAEVMGLALPVARAYLDGVKEALLEGKDRVEFVPSYTISEHESYTNDQA